MELEIYQNIQKIFLSLESAINYTTESSTTELQESDQINGEDSWENAIFSLLKRFSGTVTCVIIVCVVFCIFCSLHCVLQAREPDWFTMNKRKIFSGKTYRQNCYLKRHYCSDMCIFHPQLLNQSWVGQVHFSIVHQWIIRKTSLWFCKRRLKLDMIRFQYISICELLSVSIIFYVKLDITCYIAIIYLYKSIHVLNSIHINAKTNSLQV